MYCEKCGSKENINYKGGPHFLGALHVEFLSVFNFNLANMIPSSHSFSMNNRYLLILRENKY